MLLKNPVHLVDELAQLRLRDRHQLRHRNRQRIAGAIPYVGLAGIWVHVERDELLTNSQDFNAVLLVSRRLEVVPEQRDFIARDLRARRLCLVNPQNFRRESDPARRPTEHRLGQGFDFRRDFRVTDVDVNGAYLARQDSGAVISIREPASDVLRLERVPRPITRHARIFLAVIDRQRSITMVNKRLGDFAEARDARLSCLSIFLHDFAHTAEAVMGSA